MLEFLQAITGIFVVVYDGQHALKFHLGRAVGVVGPGVHFKIPIIQRFQVEPTKDTTLDLEPQVIQLSDELVYEVGAKVVYQIVDLRKAVIEVDKLVDGLKNRLVIIVQNVVKAQDRYTIRDMARMVDEVKQALRPVEQQWGVKVHEFGFSTFSPTPETLEITQLQKLANEKLSLYRQLPRRAETQRRGGGLVDLGCGDGAARASSRRCPSRTACPAAAPTAEHGRASPTAATGDSTSMSRNDWLHLLPRFSGRLWHIVFAVGPAASLDGRAGALRPGPAFGVMIQSGQRGVLFRWGKVVKELEPGFHWLVPMVHGVKKTPVRSVTIQLPAQKVMTCDGLVYDVSVNVVYRVDDATRALTLVDHIDAGCRAAIPIIVAEVLRVRDQAQLVDRVSLDRELTERMHAWIARWGLVVEQAGFTTIAPNKSVLHTTQLRSRTMERARACAT